MAGIVQFLAKNCSKDHQPVVSESRFDRAGHYAVSAIQGVATYDINGSTLYMSPVRNNTATSVQTALGRKTLHAPADIENDWIGFANLPHNIIAKAITFSRLGQPTILPIEMVGTFEDSEGGFRGVGIVVTDNYQGNPSYGTGVHNQDIKDLLFPSIDSQLERHVDTVIGILNVFYNTLASRTGKASPWRPDTWDINELFRVIGGFDEEGRHLDYANRDAACGGLIYIKKVLHSSGKSFCNDIGWTPAPASTSTGYSSAYNAWLYTNDYDNMAAVLETISFLLGTNIDADSVAGIWTAPDVMARQTASTFQQQ